MDFLTITNKQNKSDEIKITKYLLKSYKNIMCIIDYGSQVINEDKKKSDFDYVLITQDNNLKNPIKKDKILLNRKITINIITLKQLKKDCLGEYKYYFITKIINPHNITYCKDRKIEIEIYKIVGDFINNLRLLFNQKKYLDKNDCTSKFLLNVINLFPLYLIVVCKKLKNNKNKIWDIWSEQIFKCYKLADIKQKNKKMSEIQFIIEKGNMLIEWTNYAIQIRKNRPSYINNVIDKNETWFIKNFKVCKKIMIFLKSAKK